ncbi:uncharacterized protein LOC133737945 [Rosa rugosa]|uniref:uncharacterized protein LOC133737945 n=1 Tax=Rosa rugosa TaxID=74645 RepID=UPI002B404422|nr:uncharacterized protein LOC133737945 [Rosa rugosa]
MRDLREGSRSMKAGRRRGEDIGGPNPRDLTSLSHFDTSCSSFTPLSLLSLNQSTQKKRPRRLKASNPAISSLLERRVNSLSQSLVSDQIGQSGEYFYGLGRTLQDNMMEYCIGIIELNLMMMVGEKQRKYGLWKGAMEGTSDF